MKRIQYAFQCVCLFLYHAKIAAEYGKTPQEMAAMPDKWKTDLGSLRVIQKQTDALEGVLNSFHNNLESWDKVARGLPPTFKS